MVHKAWSSKEEVPYCFSRSYVKLQGHTALKIVEFYPNWAFPDCISSLESAMATKWCTKLAVAFKRCPIHSGWTPFYFMYDPKCSTTFPWCTINAPAVFAWCTIDVPAAFAWCTNRFVHKVEFSYIGWNGVHPLCYCFSRSSIKFQGHTALKIVEFYPNWAFPDCNSNLKSAMATKWCTKLEVA